MRYTTETAKQIKNTAVPEGGSISSFANEVRRKSLTFPRTCFGDFIKAFQYKSLKPHLMDGEGCVDLEKINTLEQYVRALLNSTKGNFHIPAEALFSIIENAEFWSGLESKYSFDELITMQVAHIIKSHCVVLYE